MDTVVPARHQLPLDTARFLKDEAPGEDAVPMDVVFVGGGPAGLAGAIRLARRVAAHREAGGDLAVEIAVLEKSAEVGQHCLSGAVVDPRSLRALFPELADASFPFRRRVTRERVYLLGEGTAQRLPTPPPMRNHGNYVVSICELVRWLGERAEALGVNVFTGFPVESLLLPGGRAAGVRTTASGLDRTGRPAAGYAPPTDLAARVVALAEGGRGPLTQSWVAREGVRGENPQVYALGVKEIWETREPLDAVVHTLGWPLPHDAFGGTFFYPLEERLAALGIVVGLDYASTGLDPHVLLQRLKTHPLFRPHLEGGELVEWGAKTIPEGGWHALPSRLHGHGVVVLGDAAGFVDVPSLKGIHYAIQSGIEAGDAIFEALLKDDVSAEGLGSYTHRMQSSYVYRDLHRTRNMRLAFKDGFFVGGVKAALMVATGGRAFGRRIEMEADAERPRVLADEPGVRPDGRLTVRKVDAVYKSGNATRDDIPSHLAVAPGVPPSLAHLYAHLCPAGVYEAGPQGLLVNAPNCVDCRATDVLGPRGSPREGGSGPRYRRM
jgi:electron-transferring-flavoprotein dehydrogenase